MRLSVPLRSAARRLLVPAALVLVTLIAMAVGVFPTRTYLDMRAELSENEERLHELQETNAGLEERIDALRRDEEIEHLARRDHGLAYPGEETYVVLPPPAAGHELPRGWPFEELEGDAPDTRRAPGDVGDGGPTADDEPAGAPAGR